MKLGLEFYRRLTEGDDRQLFGETLREVIQQAAAEPGLADEIGILRVVLARLMFVERDPAQSSQRALPGLPVSRFRRHGRGGRSAASRRRFDRMPLLKCWWVSAPVRNGHRGGSDDI